jgi:hypothetical protein
MKDNTRDIFLKNIREAQEEIDCLQSKNKLLTKKIEDLQKNNNDLVIMNTKKNITIEEYENVLRDKNIKIASLNKIVNSQVAVDIDKSNKKTYDKNMSNVEYIKILSEFERENKELKEANIEFEKRLIEYTNSKYSGNQYTYFNMDDEFSISKHKEELENIKREYKNLANNNRKLILEKNKKKDSSICFFDKCVIL